MKFYFLIVFLFFCFLINSTLVCALFGNLNFAPYEPFDFSSYLRNWPRSGLQKQDQIVIHNQLIYNKNETKVQLFVKFNLSPETNNTVARELVYNEVILPWIDLRKFSYLKFEQNGDNANLFSFESTFKEWSSKESVRKVEYEDEAFEERVDLNETKELDRKYMAQMWDSENYARLKKSKKDQVCQARYLIVYSQLVTDSEIIDQKEYLNDSRLNHRRHVAELFKQLRVKTPIEEGVWETKFISVFDDESSYLISSFILIPSQNENDYDWTDALNEYWNIRWEKEMRKKENEKVSWF